MWARIAIIGVFILVLPLFGVAEFGVSGWILFLLALLAVVPASDAAVALVNRGVTSAVGARTLPAHGACAMECPRACARWSSCRRS